MLKRSVLRRALGALAVLVTGGIVGHGLSSRGCHRGPTLVEGAPQPALALDAPRAWVAIGGGAEPASNQISLQQDVELAASVLGDGGYVLFAGGAGSQGVQVQSPNDAPRRDGLRGRLAALFAPRAGRDAHYVPITLPADGPASEAATRSALERALALRRASLLLYFSAHGEPGETPRDNVLRLWGGWMFGVSDLASMLDRSTGGSPVRVVVAACHAGGFAEIAFRDADPAAGGAEGERCGLFATTWDRVASGCDPNPRRAAQEGYALHFWHALRGEDRHGRRVPLASLDYDRDGVVGLLDAHTRARIASRSFDVPTTTSERWLRQMAPSDGAAVPVELPEELAVLRELGGRLRLDGAAALRERDQLATQQDQLADELDAVDAEVAHLSGELIGVLLARWPLLDDPWHPDFEATLAHHGDDIAALLDTSSTAAALQAAQAELDDLAQANDELLLASAGAERLVRASENIELASRLRAVGGDGWEGFRRLRACERGFVPSLRAGRSDVELEDALPVR